MTPPQVGYTFAMNEKILDEKILAEARRLAAEVFRPNAQDADQGNIHGQVEANVRMLGQAGYFGLGISPDYGGLGADEMTRREYTEVMAAACGVTAFVQQQLHAGGGFVGGGRNQALKSEKLPRFASGDELCGVAFSHLRRSGPPMVTAERTSGTRLFLVRCACPRTIISTFTCRKPAMKPRCCLARRFHLS